MENNIKFTALCLEREAAEEEVLAQQARRRKEGLLIYPLHTCYSIPWWYGEYHTMQPMLAVYKGKD